MHDRGVSQGNLTSTIFNSPLTSHNLFRSAEEPCPDIRGLLLCSQFSLGVDLKPSDKIKLDTIYTPISPSAQL